MTAARRAVQADDRARGIVLGGAAFQFGPLAVILNHNFRDTPHCWHVTAIIRSVADSAR